MARGNTGPLTGELGLFSGPVLPPRDRKGRFKRVRHSRERLKILDQTQVMRRQLGLPEHPALVSFGSTTDVSN